VYDHSFLSLLGGNPDVSLILTSTNLSFPQFHEAAILASSNPPVLFVTSNQFTYTGFDSINTYNKTVVISRVIQNATTKQWSAEVINPTGAVIRLANGGTRGANGSFIFCAQGDLVNPGGLLQLSSAPPYEASSLINNYLGTPFNSPNDIALTTDGAMWFTDPQFGFIQNIRPAPQLPPQVYRWVPGTTDIRVVADGLQAPNGIGFSPDEKTVYITDTAKNSTYPTASKTIYAYDVVSDRSGPLLKNKRTFAMPGVGIPDGIKTDAAGNVYAGCGDGVNVWNPSGRLIGKIVVPGGAANFALSENGEVFILNEQNLYLATMYGLRSNSTVL
jgi:gluconolactonase